MAEMIAHSYTATVWDTPHGIPTEEQIEASGCGHRHRTEEAATKCVKTTLNRLFKEGKLNGTFYIKIMRRSRLTKAGRLHNATVAAWGI